MNERHPSKGQDPSRIYYNPYVNAPGPNVSNPQIPFMEQPIQPHESETGYGVQPTYYYEPQLTNPTGEQSKKSMGHGSQPYYAEAQMTQTHSYQPVEEVSYHVEPQPTYYYEPQLTDPAGASSSEIIMGYENPSYYIGSQTMQPHPYPPTQDSGYSGVQPNHYTTQQPSYSTKQTFQSPNLKTPNPSYLFTGPDINVPYQHESQQGTAYHVHEFKGASATADGHQHMISGTTEPAPNQAPNHRHPYWAVTTYQDGHRHEIKGISGPAIPLQGGGHIHVIEGDTFGYPNHQHHYQEKTEPSKL